MNHNFIEDKEINIQAEKHTSKNKVQTSDKARRHVF